jgi:hypothetical protein
VDEFDFPKWKALEKILPPGMKAIAVLGKIYTPVWMFMGAETFFHSLESNEALVTALFEKIVKIQYDIVIRLLEYPSVGAIFNPDDIAHNTGLLIHPKYLRKYLYPWYGKMAEACRTLTLGSPQDVRAEVYERIRTFLP